MITLQRRYTGGKGGLESRHAPSSSWKQTVAGTIMCLVVAILVIAAAFQLDLASWGGHQNVLQLCDSDACHRYANRLGEVMDTSSDPCYDFNHYVCGRWDRSRHGLSTPTAAHTAFLVRRTAQSDSMLKICMTCPHAAQASLLLTIVILLIPT